MKTCEGCKCEMEEAFYWQEKGYDAGLDWYYDFLFGNGELHCFVFVLDKRGNFIIR